MSKFQQPAKPAYHNPKAKAKSTNKKKIQIY